jgi:hypothetical protein
MRIFLACFSFLIAGFFLLSLLLGLWHISQGRAEEYTEVHGWRALIGMEVAMAFLAGLFICAGVLVFQKPKE